MNCSRLRLLTGLVAALSVRSGGAQPDARPSIEYRVAQISASAGGVYAHAEDDWSLLTMRLVNRHNHPVEVLCVSYFDSEPTQQYGRRLWLPARARMQTWYPIRIPPLPDRDSSQVEIRSMVSTMEDTGSSLVRDEWGRLQISDTLRIPRQPQLTGIVVPLGEEGGAAESPVRASDVAATAQLELNLPRGTIPLGDRLLPASAEGLRAFDQIVLADDRVLGDEAALTTLRHWMFEGGRLWVMLDRVDPALLDALLQDESGCQVVDTVTLTSVEIAPGPDAPGGPRHAATYERPVRLVRVLVDDERVLFVVGGWPAAFTRDYGAGRLLVTTLESTAWVSKAPPGTRGLGTAEATGYVSTPPLGKLSEVMYGQQSDRPEVARLFASHVTEYIGYSIPSRRLVLGMLSGFVIALAAAGMMLVSAGRGERLAIAGPLLALVVAGVLMGAGRQQQQSVPPTRALLQLVQPLPGTDQVHVEGAAGLYAPDAGTLTLKGTEGGRVVPDMSGTAGTTRRLIRSDLDEWAWENVPLVPGLRTAEIHVPLLRPPGVRARAEFGPQGLSGILQLPGDLQAEDAVIATRSGQLGVQMESGGEFSASSTDVLSADQYLQVDFLSDEQARRTRILMQLLGDQTPVAGNGPLLCCWTRPWPVGLEGPSDERLVGSAVVLVPLHLMRPTPGTRVRLPAPLLPYRGVIGPDGLRPSGLYDYRRDQWTENLRPSSTWLRFELPGVLLPVELAAARITLHVRGPVGRLTLSVDRDSQAVPIKTWTDPIGTLEYELSGAQLPQVSADGGVLLRIDAGVPEPPPASTSDGSESGPVSYWQIEWLQMEFDAVVGEADESVRTAQRLPHIEP